MTTDKQRKIDDLLDLAFELLSREEYEKLKKLIIDVIEVAVKCGADKNKLEDFFSNE